LEYHKNKKSENQSLEVWKGVETLIDPHKQELNKVNGKM